ncbi:hypothetical protein GE061_004126 [Apolygus lucorum]|uniref:GH18 domain-containing protein n=1 Tax=Apolygus lucorum TaxID=248454 RepID=A0A8S9X063_APOLU|nr:hypothetical protein GE061_004126 [Apolygus lucorum]
MTLGWVALLLLAAAAGTKSSCDVESPTRALLCHIGSSLHASFNPCLCSHVIFPNQDFQKDAGRLKAQNPKLKILYKQSETTGAPLPEGVDGVYISLDKQPAKDAFPSELKELATKLDDLSSAKRAKAKYEGSSDGIERDELDIILELPAEPKRLAKHYDIKSLAKYVRYFVVPSDNLTDSSQDGLAYHPSRLMGIDDILNADSLVDLLSSMGAEHDQLVISLPAFGLQFTLKDERTTCLEPPFLTSPLKFLKPRSASSLEKEAGLSRGKKT